MPDHLGELIRLIDRGIDLALREYSYLQELQSLLGRSAERLPAENDEQKKHAAERSLRRKCLRLVRRAGRFERYVVRFEGQFREQFGLFVASLPQKRRAAFTQEGGITDHIRVWSAALLKYTSRSTGEIAGLLKSGSGFDASSVLKKVNEAVKEAVRPFLAGMYKLKQYLIREQEELREAMEENNALVVDLDGALQRSHLSLPKNTHILIDADFAHALEEQRNQLQKTAYAINVSYPLVIPQTVLREMQRRKGVFGPPLVSRQLLAYLTTKLGATIAEVHPNEKEKTTILTAWRNFAPQGRSATEYHGQEFLRSGDCALLAYGLRRLMAPTIILSNNDSELGKIAMNFNRLHKANIIVVRYEEMPVTV